MSILNDLQSEIVEPNCDLTSILRKALIISHKLKLSEFETWVRKELQGYNSKDELIPEYRVLYGKVKYFNPFHGWQSIIFDSTESEILYTRREIYDSIPKCLSLINSQQKNFQMSFSPETQSIIWKDHPNIQMETYLLIDRNQLIDIVEKVKTELLDWTLLLSDKGITGINVDFSKEEQNLAQSIPEIKNYHINIYGNVENSQIQQSTKNLK